MTLIPVINRTTYCFHDCGKCICSCKPTIILNKITTMKNYYSLINENQSYIVMADNESDAIDTLRDYELSECGESLDDYKAELLDGDFHIEEEGELIKLKDLHGDANFSQVIACTEW